MVFQNVYVSSSEKISSYTGNKMSFIGDGDLNSPNAISQTRLSMENALGVPSCIAIEMEIELEPYEDKKVFLILGEEENKEDIYIVLNKYDNVNSAEMLLKDTKDYWSNMLRKLQVKTNDEQIDFMLNRLDIVSDNCM